jgi:DNA-binding CsgD family transcriptional regulator
MRVIAPLLHWTEAQVHVLRGNWDAAETSLRLGDAGPHDYPIMRVPACLARAQHAEARADYRGVLRALAPLTEEWARGDVAEPGLWPWTDVYANALVVEGRLEEAGAFLDTYEKVAIDRGHRSARARLGYARGRLLGAHGRLDESRAAFQGAIALLDELPLRHDRARANFAFGQTLRRAGKRREADAVIRTARDLYAGLGASTYVARCDRELKAGGLSIVRGERAFDELTPQEKSVAELVARGFSNREVGAELFISTKTVQYHLTRVYTKLGVRSRAELAGIWRADPGADRA